MDAEARRRASLDFGHSEQVKQQIREVHVSAIFESVLFNLKAALRFLRKSPSFSLAVILTRIPELQFIDSQPSDIPWMIHASALLLLLGVGYALYQSRARLAEKSTDQIFIWRPAFEGVAVERSPGDHPVLSEAHAYLECEVVHRCPAGDHELLIAGVLGGRRLNEGEPMVHIRKKGSHY